LGWRGAWGRACWWRCCCTRVRQGDVWRVNQALYQLVYLFQRPESMDRAVEKAAAELQPGAWLVSLEFPAEDLVPNAALQDRGRPVWAYQVPFQRCSIPEKLACSL